MDKQAGTQAKGAPKRNVLRADQSPMNFRRWCLTLACGHEAWVTRVSRPTVAVVKCERCKAEGRS